MYSLPFVFFLLPVYLLFWLVFFGLVQIGAVGVAQNLGLHPDYIFLLLLGSLVGSYLNLPLTKIKCEEVVSRSSFTAWMDWRFKTPSNFQQKQTVLAVNLGGAIIPVLFSIYLLFLHPELFPQALIATAVVSLVVNGLARPAPGVGIVLPLFIPPLLAALSAILIAPGNSPVVAYVAGTLGTLIGADLLNLRSLSRSGAEMASIGGAGTFDGIFLTGLLAVLLS